jgi:hypothetical protein
MVISQIESAPVEGTSQAYIGDNFFIHQNPMVDPPLSPNWDTKPKLINFRLFGNMANEEERNVEAEREETFGFPILDLAPNVNMKNILPSILPNFRGMIIEYLDAFFFEFDIPCRIYNYVDDAKKLKLFSATLKDSTLQWFMGLREYSNRYWEYMKTTFLKKYQDYCRTKDS